MKIKRILSSGILAVTAALCLFTTTSAQGDETVYSLGSSFSLLQNPNDVWTYGYYSGADALNPVNFTLYSTFTSGTGAYTGLDTWVRPSLTNPMVIYNTGATDILDAGTGQDFAPHTLYLGPQNAPCVVRWTAPSDGTILISSTFQNSQKVNRYVDVALIYGGTVQWSQALSPNLSSYNAGQTGSFVSGTISVTAGSSFDFVAWDGNSGSDNTATVSGNIRFKPVPEPSSGLLIGLGALFLASRRRMTRE